MDPTHAPIRESARSQSLRLDTPRPPDPLAEVIILAEEIAAPPTTALRRREAAQWLTDIAR